MKKKIYTLSKTGNKHFLHIEVDKPTLAKLKIDENTKFEFSTSKSAMKIVPVKKKKAVAPKKTKKSIGKIADSILDAYDEAFKKLSKT